MSLAYSILTAVLPAIALLCYFYECDLRQNKSQSGKVKAFLLGVSSILPASIIEAFVDRMLMHGKFGSYMQSLSSVSARHSIPVTDALQMGFLGSALIEESIKMLYLYLVFDKSKEFQSKKDTVIHAVTLSVGFAFVENILYVVSYGAEIAEARAFMSLPMHAIAALAMSFTIAFRREQSHQPLWQAWAIALLAATLIHGTYNSLLFINTFASGTIVFVFVIVAVVLAVRLYRNLDSQSDRMPSQSVGNKPLQQSPQLPRSPGLDWKHKPKAIAKFLNRALESRRINASVDLDGDRLQVLLEGAAVPPQNLAQSIFKKLLSLDIPNARSLKVYGKVEYEKVPSWSQEFVFTLSLPERAIAVDPSSRSKLWYSPLTWILISVGLISAGCFLPNPMERFHANSQAQKDLSASQEGGSGYSDTDYVEQGDRKYDRGDYRGAIEDFNRAISLNPNNAIAYNYRSLSHSELGDLEEAIQDCNKALEIDPEYALAYFNRAGYRTGKNDLNGALEDYDRAIQAKGDLGRKGRLRLADIYANRGDVLGRLGRYTEALRSSQQALQIAPKHQYAWFVQSMALSYLDRYEEALAAINKAVELDPPNAEAWNYRGNILYTLQRYNEALTSYEKAIQIAPRFRLALRSRAALLNELGRDREALEAYDRLIQLYPNDREAMQTRNALAAQHR
ncbi:tetratricopeptide repeat protein [Tumidithrix elongata RA019]|uniref:Tetratricopeptide repeat protein n=1 Tax=Tumidithrix elongata BACA0141 TaxID=2716417 RepID=A0AAW9PVR5_9CYAN|nr:tetratricopeptide repeat protein [Tumidithrix elongata RA019]